jgi:hypothetical protein
MLRAMKTTVQIADAVLARLAADPRPDLSRTRFVIAVDRGLRVRNPLA